MFVFVDPEVNVWGMEGVDWMDQISARERLVLWMGWAEFIGRIRSDLRCGCGVGWADGSEFCISSSSSTASGSKALGEPSVYIGETQ